MLKFVSLLALSIAVLEIKAQNFIDKYLTDPLVYTTVGSSTHGVSQPKDLDFKPNSNELWVVNYGNASGGTVIVFYNAGLPNQSHQFRKDSHTSHFMRQSSALAIGDNGEWASTGEIRNSNGSPTSTFMGPSLWSGDTAIFARVFQNPWSNGFPLGSHLSMLHQSPFAMGIAHDTARVYYVFDGHNGNLARYDFLVHHSPGYDNGANRLLRVNINTGSVAGNLTVPSSGNEPLSGYYNFTGATQQTVATYTSLMSGVDYYNNRLIVSNYANGDILVYNTSTPSPTLLGTIVTGQPGIMGVKIGPDGKIWFVNNTQNSVVRIDPLPATVDASIAAIVSPVVATYEPHFHAPQFDVCAGTLAPVVTLQNKGTVTLSSATITYKVGNLPTVNFNWTGSLASGASVNVTLPSSSVPNGSHKLVVYTSNPNSTTDANPKNDTREGSFRALSPVASLPFVEDFSAPVFPPAGWDYRGFNRYCFMSRIATVGGFGTGLGCLRMDNFSGSVNISGQKDYFMSPRINLSTATPSTTLDFDVAYRRYDNNSTDQLEIKASIDCGVTWTTIYNKSGSTLATAPNGTTAFVPTATQWRLENISLGSLVGQTDVLFLFETTSDWGNHIYIDNIRINSSLVGQPEEPKPGFSLAPNPSGGVIQIASENEMYGFEVINSLGVRIFSELETATQYSLDLSLAPKGIYFIRVFSGGKILSGKVVLQ
jgi:hypothetical protein